MKWPKRGRLNCCAENLEYTVKLLIKDTLKEDKPPNKGQAENTLVYIIYKKITSERGQTSQQRTSQKYSCIHNL